MAHSDPSKGTQIQARDEALLAGLLDVRFLTIRHAAALHFDGRFEAAKKRMQKLLNAGLLARLPRRPQDQAIHVLGRKGYDHLLNKGKIEPSRHRDWNKIKKRQSVSELFLRHELAVLDVRVAFLTALQARTDLQVAELSTDAERHAFKVVAALPRAGAAVSFRSRVAKPDGFLHVRQCEDGESPRDHHFYIELDRGTESLRRLAQKASHYSQHYRKGGFAAKLGHGREDFKRHPFRVLMIFPAAERRNNVAEKLLGMKTPLKTMIWLTTMPEILADPLGPIWIRPADYLDAVRGSSRNLTTANRPYRRNPEREGWIETQVVRQALLPATEKKSDP